MIKIKLKAQVRVEVHTFDPSAQEARTGEFLRVGGQPGLDSEPQASCGYKERCCLKMEQLKFCKLSKNVDFSHISSK